MWFFIVIIGIYSLVLLYFTNTWKKISTPTIIKPYLKISVIVPFRNEERSLPALVNSFQQLDYPNQLVEFIFINDHSNDQSMFVLDELLKNLNFTNQVINLPQGIFGKKMAIETAVDKATNPIILSTDADCAVPTKWLQLMQSPFHNESVHLVSGSVVFTSENFQDTLFQMEFAPLIGVGGVSIKLGKASLANGANIAFRKKTFIDLEIFRDNSHIPTGDDIFLVQKIRKNYPYGISFQKQSIVQTAPPASILTFFQQRIRWASKWKAASNRKDKFPALAVWFFHLIYLMGIIGFISEEKLMLAVVLFMLKGLAEFFFIFYILKSQLQKFNFIAFLLLQLLYSFYVITFGLMANFSAYQWKGRIYGKHER